MSKQNRTEEFYKNNRDILNRAKEIFFGSI